MNRYKKKQKSAAGMTIHPAFRVVKENMYKSNKNSNL